jgi:hypothetical protein
VFESVRTLAAAGETSTTFWEGLNRRHQRRCLFLVASEGRYRRVYTRGTAEYLQARRAGLLQRLPALATAPAEAVEEAESVIGHRLPLSLMRLYLEVGNGGFGPGYGVFGLTGGHHDHLGQTALDWYRQAHDTPESYWSGLPASLLRSATGDARLLAHRLLRLRRGQCGAATPTLDRKDEGTVRAAALPGSVAGPVVQRQPLPAHACPSSPLPATVAGRGTRSKGQGGV